MVKFDHCRVKLYCFTLKLIEQQFVHMESTFCPIRSTYFPLDILGVLLAFQNVSQTKPGKRYLIFFSLLAYSYCAGGGSCLGGHGSI